MEEEITEPGITWEKPHFYLDGKIFIPKIYDAPKPEVPIPEGFNAVKIAFDGSLKSDLNWQSARETAQKYVQQGLLLFWEIDLGLFNKLPNPLSNQSQYLSLGLSLEHFRDTLWKDFRDRTIGLSIYRGPADLSHGYPWDESQQTNLREWLKAVFNDIAAFVNETGISTKGFDDIDQKLLSENKIGLHILSLFCRDAAAEFLDMLTNRLPDALQLFLMMDCSKTPDPLQQIHLISRERYDRFHLAVKGGKLSLSDLTWQEGLFIKQVTEIDEFKIGISIPPIEFVRPSHYQGMEKLLEDLVVREMSFRIIPETFLITEWSGLDYLIVISKGVSSQGLRKLKGFCAAGGTVVVLGEKLGMPNEVAFDEWLKLNDE